MSCHRQPGPAAFISQIERVTGLTVTQADWHAVRQLAKADGREMSRRTADDDTVQAVSKALGEALGVRLPGRVAVQERQTVGTASTIAYLAEYGVTATFERVRVAAAWDRDLTVYLMPIVSLRDETPSSFEALARWERGGQVITPDGAFAGGANPESTSRIALVQAAAHARELGSPVSVNLTAGMLADPSALQAACDTCDNIGSEHALLVIEALENQPLTDPEVVAMMDNWRAAGFTIALDDYGSGYANADAARALQPSIIKTDASLIQNGDETRLREAVAVAREIGATVTVEGIETSEQAELARRVGADRGQGWLYGKAAPAPEA